MCRLLTIIPVLSLGFGCTMTRTYDTWEASLRRAIPIAALQAMNTSAEAKLLIPMQEQFDTSTRAYVGFVNLFGLEYVTLRVTWEQLPKPGNIRVTANAWSNFFIYGGLINYPDFGAMSRRNLTQVLSRYCSFVSPATRVRKPSNSMAYPPERIGNRHHVFGSRFSSSRWKLGA